MTKFYKYLFLTVFLMVSKAIIVNAQYSSPIPSGDFVSPVPSETPDVSTEPSYIPNPFRPNESPSPVPSPEHSGCPRPGGDPARVIQCFNFLGAYTCCYPGEECIQNQGMNPASYCKSNCPVAGYPEHTKACAPKDGSYFCCKSDQECGLDEDGNNKCFDEDEDCYGSPLEPGAVCCGADESGQGTTCFPGEECCGGGCIDSGLDCSDDGCEEGSSACGIICIPDSIKCCEHSNGKEKFICDKKQSCCGDICCGFPAVCENDQCVEADWY